MRPPVVVRLEGFPERLRLVRGRSSSRDSGVVVASDQDANIAVSLRLPYEPFTFENGETEITQIESFTAGEQREVVIDWALRDDTGAYIQYVYLEIDVRYEDDEESLNTATLAIPLDYGLNVKRLALVGAVAAAAFGAALMTAARRAVTVAEEDDVTIGIVEVDVPKRKASSKKRTASQASAKKTSTKKASTKKAGGTPRGSGASRSAPRKDARGSSAARKSSAGRSTRKSR
jgi:hypothetical protein